MIRRKDEGNEDDLGKTIWIRRRREVGGKEDDSSEGKK